MFIVLDLDEVLVDFTGGAAKVHGLSIPEMGEKFGSWWSGNEFWNGIRRYGEQQFWEDLTLLPWAFELISWVEEVSDDWIIVTAPSASPECYVGKVNWLKKNLGKKFSRYMITPHKFLLAKEGRVLIDDSEKNLDSFKAHGGETILFPSRFNSASMHYDNPYL